jgi:dTDP-4-amino-4,6-dideoxygalactose transaminase
MDAINALARKRDLIVIEDAAQGLGARWNDRALGTLGALGVLSFHATKNVGCGEGGALIVNDEALIERAEIIWEKGTNRLQHHQKKVDKYRWLDVGSSFLPSDITASLLDAQLEQLEAVTERRRAIWTRYHDGFAELERSNKLRRPCMPRGAEGNGHLYYLVLPDQGARDALLAGLATRGVHASTHYVPLHSAPAGELYGRAYGRLRNTEMAAEETLRLPLYFDLGDAEVDAVIAAVRAVLAD